MTDQKHIAIVAVHGVGDHEPHASATAISRLLLRIPRAFGGRYTSFSEVPIGIPVAPVPEDVTEEQIEWRKSRPVRRRTSRQLYDERPERDVAGDKEPPLPGIGEPPPDVRFMRDQLRGYSGNASDAVYETVRIEGQHLAPDNPDGTESSLADARIDVYEMYWSDISKVGKSFLSIFGTFYQVVIHLPYVGLITLEASRKTASVSERATKSTDWLWGRWLGSYSWAMRAMTLVGPTLNVLMLAIGLGALTMSIPRGSQRWVAVIAPALAVFAGATWLIYRRRTRWWLLDVTLPAVIAIIVFVAAWRIDGPLQPGMALVLEWWLITTVPLFLLFRAFNEHRPFALPLAAVLWVAIGITIVVLAATHGQNPTVAVVGTLEILNAGLLLTWFVFALSTLMVTVFGWMVERRVSLRRRPMTRRAAYTARFALAMPGVAFAVVTLTMWGLLVAAEGGRSFRHAGAYRPLFTYPALDRHKEYDRDLAVARAIADSIDLTHRGMIDSAAHVRSNALAAIDGPAYFLRAFGGSSDGVAGLVNAILIGGALIALVWVLVPVLIAEVKSPSLDRELREQPGFSERARKLGSWLSTAFRAGRISGEMLVLATILSIVGTLIAAPIPLPAVVARLVSQLPPLHFGFMEVGGWAFGAGAVGLYALFTRVSFIGKRVRPIFGIMADVDNYLRERPAQRTPRAQMAERYTSLLRYLCRWRDGHASTKGYDAIILVSHSQGTVLTADLLRYLKHYRAGEGAFEPHLAPIARSQEPVPIYLMTMGSPLRQIYGQRFPDIYSWVGGSMGGESAEPIPRAASLFGVQAWINLYRSGDYVGRALWCTPDDNEAFYDPRRAEVNQDERRGEACIGAGAHTHYWDETAEPVAVALDAVVRDVIHETAAAILIDDVIVASNEPPGNRSNLLGLLGNQKVPDMRLRVNDSGRG